MRGRKTGVGAVRFEGVGRFSEEEPAWLGPTGFSPSARPLTLLAVPTPERMLAPPDALPPEGAGFE